MIKKLKNNLIIINIIIIFFFNNIVRAATDFYIVSRVDNEIITNIDVMDEINYLIALNNELKEIDQKSLINIAKNSLIKEKIKKNEINKYFKSPDAQMQMMDKLIENFYKKLNLNNQNEFENYLASYNLELNDVKKKIRIEVLWNQHIYRHYKDKLNINEEELKKKVSENKSVNKKITKYLLSEILFSVENKKDYEKKNIEIRESIKSNGFKTTANIYSLADTAKFGGKIGLLEKKQLPKKITKEISLIKPGEITSTIDVPNGYLILKLEDIIIEEFEKDLESELSNLIRYETDKQLNQFSIIHFNKLELNSKIIYE